MFNKFLLSILLAVTLVACVDNSNPDAGKLTRLLCYQVETPGDALSRIFDFSIVVTQDNLEIQDASYFVPGNKLASEIGSSTIPFTIRVYKDAGLISEESDVQHYAAALLEQPADATHRGTGSRMMNSFSFYWNGRDGYVSLPTGKPDENVYVNRDAKTAVLESKYLWCENAWGVPAG